MNNKKLQVLKKEKEAQDLVQKLNRTFYDIRNSYQGLVNLVKKIDLSRDKKQEIMQEADQQIQTFKNLLNRLNNLFELEKAKSWERIWRG